MATAVVRGYATASTDTGHSTPGGAWALDRPDLVLDFAYRAIHEMTIKSKAIVEAFYGNAAQRSYFVGCSTGGRQALMEAQRFPNDYDGIVAGAPANYWTRLMSVGLSLASATLKESASRIWHAQYALLHKSVLAACDARDGVRDGLIGNPERCNFDPKVLQCAGAPTDECLTAAQVDSARKMYGPILIARTKQQVFPGLARGSEREWHVLAGGPDPFPIVVDFYKYFVHGNPDWDWKTFDNDLDVSTADAKFGKLMNAVDPNLRPFKERGGKLILYHGWNDDRISPFNTINYYNSVKKEMGSAATDDFARLFMAPGMLHCAAAAPGPNIFDVVGALDQWVEKAVKPDKLIASHSTSGVVDRTRPLCPYPQAATYRGTGSTDDAASFVCK
jgi:feruloyl esterase